MTGGPDSPRAGTNSTNIVAGAGTLRRPSRPLRPSTEALTSPPRTVAPWPADEKHAACNTAATGAAYARASLPATCRMTPFPAPPVCLAAGEPGTRARGASQPPGAGAGLCLRRYSWVLARSRRKRSMSTHRAAPSTYSTQVPRLRLISGRS